MLKGWDSGVEGGGGAFNFIACFPWILWPQKKGGYTLERFVASYEALNPMVLRK